MLMVAFSLFITEGNVCSVVIRELYLYCSGKRPFTPFAVPLTNATFTLKSFMRKEVHVGKVATLSVTYVEK